VNGVPERFVPGEMHGELIEAEHLLRYHWAARFVAGRSVLDAGCGTGYGTMMLASAGARRVTGVDIAGAVIALARQSAAENVFYETADVAQLPHVDASFDVVVCFETIEHVHDPAAVLDELKRVLAPGGLLLISSPNRDRTIPGSNPHHVHEYTPDEFRDALQARFPRVRLVQQHSVLASVISVERQQGLLPDASVWSVAPTEAGDEHYMLAAAGREIPDLGSSALTLAGFMEVRYWDSQLASAHAACDEARRQSDEARQQSDEARQQSDEARQQIDEARQQSDEARQQSDEARQQSDEARRQLHLALTDLGRERTANAATGKALLAIESELALAKARAAHFDAQNAEHWIRHNDSDKEIEGLTREIEGLTREIERLRKDVASAERRAIEGQARADRTVAAMANSLSWKLTVPLRAAARQARRLRRR
jgi:SAM-dependent methyltransferase